LSKTKCSAEEDKLNKKVEALDVRHINAKVLINKQEEE